MDLATNVVAPDSVWSQREIKRMIERIDTQSYRKARRLVQLLVDEKYSPTDAEQCSVLKHALKHIIKKNPHAEQIETLKNLIFNKCDVLLIAKTGFGKSCLFHTPSLLLRKMTLIITPLTKLGEEQMDDINRVPGAKACIIDAETKRRDRHLLSQVEAGLYTHIILSPEQIMSDEFKKVLKNPVFINNVCLVAIDEAHLIENWKDFREDYTHLESLRRWLPAHVPMFCCSGTISRKVEADVRKYSGLREEDGGPYSLRTIRTSVDRPELSVVLLSMGKFTDFSPLLFLFNDCEPTVNEIPKTIIFIDDHSMVHAAMEYLRQAASRKGYSPNSVYCFTSRVAEEDKAEIYDKFKHEGGDIRIIVATTSLGMGMNIPDIDVVIQWDRPLSEDIGDLWQRFGRSARQTGRRGRVYAFLPTSLFKGKTPKRGKTTAPGQTLASCKRPRTMRNMLSGTRREIRSSQVEQTPTQSQAQVPFTPLPSGRRGRRKVTLSQTPAASQMPPPSLPASQFPWTPKTPGIMQIDRMSIASASIAGSIAGTVVSSIAGSMAASVMGEPKEMGEKEGAASASEPLSERAIEWRMISSYNCYRKGILLHLQEEIDERRDRMTCCNACNPELNPVSQMEPWEPEGQKVAKPAPSSRAGLALVKIRAWCQHQGRRLSLLDDQEFSIVPSELYMTANIQRKVAQLFNTARLGANFELLEAKSKAALSEKLKPMQWEYMDHDGEAERLLDFLYSIRQDVASEFTAKGSNRKKKTGLNVQEPPAMSQLN